MKSNKTKAAKISVFSNLLLITIKLIAGIITGSIGILSEAMHSALDLFASFIALHSVKKSIEPADKEHTYGHGKYENLSGLLEGGLILIAALLIIIESIRFIINGSKIELLYIGIVIMIISIISNTIVSVYLFKVAKKEKSLALRADALHLSTDVLTSLTVLISLVIIKYTHLDIVDPISAIVVALIIIKAGVDIMLTSSEGLLDKALPEDIQKIIIDEIDKLDAVSGYHKLRTRTAGNDNHIDFHIQVRKDMSFDEAHQLCTYLENAIKNKIENAFVLVHPEPAHNIKEDKKIN